MDDQPISEAAPEVRWGLGDAIVGEILTLVVPGIVGAVVLSAGGYSSDQDLSLWLVSLLQMPLWIVLFASPLWASRRKGLGSLADDFGLRMRWRDIPIGLGIGFVAQLALGLALQAFYHLIGVDTDKVGETAKSLTDRANDPAGVILLFVVVVVAAPVFEELFYRGLWLRALEKRWGSAWAIGISAVLFGAVHFQPYDFPALAAIGLLTSLLTIRFGRLGPAIWLHVAFNLTAVISLM